jgi:hypothetical protein
MSINTTRYCKKLEKEALAALIRPVSLRQTSLGLSRYSKISNLSRKKKCKCSRKWKYSRK